MHRDYRFYRRDNNFAASRTRGPTLQSRSAPVSGRAAATPGALHLLRVTADAAQASSTGAFRGDCRNPLFAGAQHSPENRLYDDLCGNILDTGACVRRRLRPRHGTAIHSVYPVCHPVYRPVSYSFPRSPVS